MLALYSSSLLCSMILASGVYICCLDKPCTHSELMFCILLHFQWPEVSWGFSEEGGELQGMLWNLTTHLSIFKGYMTSLPSQIDTQCTFATEYLTGTIESTKLS